MCKNNITKSVSMHVDQHEEIMKHLRGMKYDGDFSVWARKAFRNLMRLERKQSLQEIADSLDSRQQEELIKLIKEKKEYVL